MGSEMCIRDRKNLEPLEKNSESLKLMRVTSEQGESGERDEDELQERHQYLDFLKEIEMCM